MLGLALLALLPALANCQNWTQNQLDNFAQTLKISWKVKDNLEFDEKFFVEVTLTNDGVYTLNKNGGWGIYLTCIMTIESDKRPRPGEAVLEGQGIKVTHIQGSYFRIEPTETFFDLPPNRSRKLKLQVQYWQVSRTDSMPNWYFAVPGLDPKVIQSTVGEELSFVESLTMPQQVKRYDFDKYTPFTAQERYRRNYLDNTADDGEVRLIPKPLSMTVDKSSSVTINPQTWRVYASSSLTNEANYFNQMSSIPSSGANMSADVIRMRIGYVDIADGGLSNSLDNYRLTIDPATRVIEITGQGASGVFYGAQTLLSLMSQRNNMVYKTVITDSPRYQYRGLLLDVARNFHSKETVKRLMGNMATYKLNRLHLHISEDEGWRLEIPGLDELTNIGSKRCHDLSEMRCIYPQLGSGPDTTTSGSGFYTRNDYREILQEANRLHIQVVPEFDMPGHSRAAIKSMEARYQRLKAAGQEQEGRKYLLVEEGDPSRYLTAQMFTDNNLNPCLESTYTFIEHVLREVIQLHEGIQPLRLYHYGGDEIGIGAWENSTTCKNLFNVEKMTLPIGKEYFFKRLSNITSTFNLSMGVWHHGIIPEGNQPFDRSQANNRDVIAYVGSNVWEWGLGQRSYILANQGYKVVMVHTSHLFFDHPYEPDPEERGYYWATRFTDTRKSFSYTPENIYSLIRVKRSGDTISRTEVCGANDEKCPSLEKTENIAGIQGALFSELVRTQDHIDSQLFPRVLALAERAWHKASWEDTVQTEAGMEAMKADWESFAKLIGRYELRRLDSKGVKYRLPLPGAIVENGFLKHTATYPGLPVQYSRDDGNTWYTADNNVIVRPWDTVLLRTRTKDMSRASRVVTLNGVEPLRPVDQPTVDYIAESLDIKYVVLDNFQDGVSSFVAQTTLKNKGERDIVAGNWAIYFYILFTLPDIQPELRIEHMTITHVKGGLFKMEPTPWFKPLRPQETRKIKYRVKNWSVSRTDMMPNWYVWAEGMKAKTIPSTRGPEIDFVQKFTNVKQYQRYNTSAYRDRYSPYSPSMRYDMDMDIPDLKSNQHRIIPKPVTMVIDESMEMMVSALKVIVTDPKFQAEAELLSEYLSGAGIYTNVSTTVPPSSGHIRLYSRDPRVIINNMVSSSPEAYALTVNPMTESVNIWSTSAHGIFNGIASFLTLALKADPSYKLNKVTIEDAPRFEYRGMHLDVGRNFHSKETVLKLLDAMGMYKLNKFHFHLTEDEGWRVEIPGMEELTKIGGQRCHDLSEEKCLITQWGSGPDTTTSGTGFYTVEDYQDILRYAKARHIEVIPEVESPGHGHAAIVAMKKRRQHLLDIGDFANADLYRLHDLNDSSDYLTNQLFKDNAINPCIPSTYRFFAYVVDKFIELHKDISPLKTFHFGGDEVGVGAWLGSLACQALSLTDITLKEYFTQNIANITTERGLNLGGWEDGLMESVVKPFDRKEMGNGDVTTYAWDNVWEWGVSSRAYTMANAGYKVVLAHVTHLYFDHPYEPDPEERGFYWGPRFTDPYKTFGYLPDSVYDNVDVKRSGEVMTKKDLCGNDGSACVPLEKPENILGMQGHLWSETVRKPEHLFYMIFPRMLAVAERAWHKAAWEDILDDKDRRERAKREDWRNFTNTLGYQEFPTLDFFNISYRIPPPGVKVMNGRLRVVTPMPGLPIETSTDGGKTWKEGKKDMKFDAGQTVMVALKSSDGKRRGRAVSVYIPVPPLPSVSQATLDYMAENLTVQYVVLDNLQNGTSTFIAEITLTNVGKRDITAGNWDIYFYILFLLPDHQPDLDSQHLTIKHVKGCLFKMEPTRGFKTLKPQETRKIKYRVNNWSVSRTDMMPNLYVWSEGLTPKIINNTKGPDIDFVQHFTEKKQYKRYNDDRYTPYSPSVRYDMDKDIPDLGSTPYPIIPTPVSIKIDKSTEMMVSALKVIVTDPQFQAEAEYLREQMVRVGISSITVSTTTPPSTGFIRLYSQDPNVLINNVASPSPEAYALTIDPGEEAVNIWSTSAHGIFNGIISFLNLALKPDHSFKLNKVTIEDAPRFEYRGMHLDVGRNFHSKETVLKLLDAMGMYKLNKFHFHLTEDEGWRVEIPGMEELTTIGGQRCHDLSEKRCVITQWGSGPDTNTSGSGFYTVEDYQDILRFAKSRHIEVIPEVESPGHGNAAIVAMKNRQQRFLDTGDYVNADLYTLHDPEDASDYLTNQLFKDNGINPCIPSTYRFFAHIVDTFKELHKDIMPLKTFHFGGDEVGVGAWLGSPACQHLLKANVSLKEYFTQNMAKITSERGLNLGGWEDGLMESVTQPFNRGLLGNKEVTTYAWDNVWEWGVSSRAYTMANAGYKVVLAPVTHLYFDHPYEPDPEERGFYWGPRFTDPYKTFGYLPDSVYDNVDVKRSGEVMTKKDLCGNDGSACVPLEKPENILGMQGHLWSETVRKPEHLFYMIFPRMLAMAERAWHKAAWEDILDDKDKHNTDKREDWKKFTNSLGYQEFPALDFLGIGYRIPPPGARVIDGHLKVVSPVPGLPIETSTDGGKTWRKGNKNMRFNAGQTVMVALKSVDGLRRGRAVSVRIPRGGTTSTSGSTIIMPSFFIFISYLSYILCL